MDRSSRRTPRTDPGLLASGLASKLGELEAAVARQSSRFAALIDMGAQLSSARDVDQLLRTVMERLASLLQAEAATLFMHDPGARELWSRTLQGAAMQEIRIAQDRGIAGYAFTHGRTLHLGDAYSDARFNPDIDRRSGFRTRSVIAVPLRHLSGRVLGVVQVLHRQVDAFTPDDRLLAEGVATQIAAVLDHLLLLEELKRGRDELAERVHQLDALYEVEQAIASTTAQSELLELILGQAMALVQARAGSLLLMDEDGERLTVRATRGPQVEGLQGLRLPLGRGIAGQVAARGEVVRVARAEDSAHFDRALARRRGLASGALLCVPIRAEERSLGVLELVEKKGGFTEADEHLAVMLAGQAGRALVQRQSREELERRNRLATIGQMLSGVLHDVRTPLTVISGYTEMMAGEPDGALRGEMAKIVHAQMEHVSAMQQETLAFVRGERSVLIRKVFLHAFMKELTEQLQQEFAASKVELRVHAGYTGAARFDESKLKRVIFNLARNAIDAMPEGGRFLLGVEREGPELVFRARDNGPGIPPEVASRLFESFVTAGKKHGTGLGLAIVKKLVEEHGGSVSCKTQVGKGTAFEVRLPAGTPES